MRKLEAKNINRIIVRGTNCFSDDVMTVTAIQVLRHLLPEAHIALATSSFAKGIFDGADFLDELVLCDPGGRFRSVFTQASEWRRRDFDLAVLFQNAFQAALIAFMARVPFRIGYATQH